MATKSTYDLNSLTKEEKEFFKYRKLKDKFFIGRFNETETGYTVSDIRRSDFSKIKYKPSNKKSFTISIDGFFDEISTDDAYYRFTWKMVKSKPEYIFDIDDEEDIVLVKPKNIVNLIYEDIVDYPASASEKIVNTLDTLKNQLTASGKEVFIYELLQNANDYPQKINGIKQSVDVEFHITDNYLVFLHSGDYFDAKNIAAICSINDKEKTDNSEAIGYKGIGFKTVFLDNNYVLLRTGDYQFRFDYEKTKNIDDTPWQILPIWTDDKEVAEEVLDVMDNADEKYRVQIALRPTENDILHDGEQNYEELFADVFETERVILFIPYINSVSVYTDDCDTPSIVSVKENDKWCVSESKHYVGDIPEEFTNELNSRIEKNDGKIPEKYYDFRKTSVGFACKKEGNKLLPVENTCLYCYLPAKKAKWGFNFLMNTDMIPTGPRDNVEPKEKINHAIAKIAGQQFFYWIQDLLLSNEYDFESIFGLIPDFKALRRRIDDEDVRKFIREFQEGFENELDSEPIIPVIDEKGLTVLKLVEEVNYDEIGITCAELMSDDELRERAEWSDYFVHPDCRDLENQCLKPNIDGFMRRYVADGYTFNKKQLLICCEKPLFVEWLKDQENNNNFLDFLIVKGIINDFKNKKIFLTEEGDIDTAISIYENIDEYYDDLVAFSDYLPRLSKGTRDFFGEDEDWMDVKEKLFKEFDPDYFVDNILLKKNNVQNTFERLKDPAASYGFFNYLAKNVGYSSDYMDFPFINFNGNPVDNFNGNVFFHSSDGEELLNEEWVDSSWFSLISDGYSNVAKKYIKKHFEISVFTLKSFVSDILFSDKVKKEINTLGDEHLAFVRYCYNHRELFKNGAFSQFTLWSYDKSDENVQIPCSEVIFFNESSFEEYQKKVWIKKNWMYRIDPEYFDNIEDKTDFCKFLASRFNVHDFTMDSFYRLVVSKHIGDICKKVGSNFSSVDTDESIDILNYLGENFKLIFDEKREGENFKKLSLFAYDTWTPIKDRKKDVYLYDKELEDTLEAKWVPGATLYMLEETYQEVFTKYPKLIKALELKQYSFKTFMESLFNNFTSLCNTTDNKNANLAFHRYMFANKDELSKKDYENIANIKLIALTGSFEMLKNIDNSIYISDIYMEEGKGIESMVKKYDDIAFFTSEAYLDKNDKLHNNTEWAEYFKNLGVNYNIKDIIINSVIPNLYDIQDVSIVPLLAQYYYDLHKEEVWDVVINDLCDLQVLTRSKDEKFVSIGDAVFNDCYTTEPYPDLVIGNEVSMKYRSYQDSNVMRLLNEIAEEANAKTIHTIEDWKKEKLQWYLECQKKGIDVIENIHVHYIQGLAADYNKDAELYDRKDIRNIKLIDTNGNYLLPKELTRGSKYQPRCDFERFGLKLNYLSETYLPFEDPDPKVFWKIFNDMGITHDFLEEHIPLMADNYDFAVYFWTEYLTVFANRTHLTALNVEKLKPYAVIPVANKELRQVKKATELYSLGLINDGYVINSIPLYSNKIALEAVYSTDAVKNEILTKLDFASSLSFDDCLCFLLNVKDKSKRYKVLEWLSYKSTINYSAVSAYLKDERSIWRNGRGEYRKLNDLYVIDIEEKRLKQLFGKSEKVMQTNFIESSYVFSRFCTIFGITALKQEDFKLKPSIIEDDTTRQMRHDLKLPILIIAAIEGNESWEELYISYESELNNLSFHRCSSISLNYNDALMDNSIMYHVDDKEIYFVNDWMHRRVFKDFVSNFKEILDIDLVDNVLEAVFEADNSNKESIIEQYVSNDLAKDAHFVSVLKELDENIAKGFESKKTFEEESVNQGFNYGSGSVDESFTDDNSEYEESANKQADSSNDGSTSYNDDDSFESKSTYSNSSNTNQKYYDEEDENNNDESEDYVNDDTEDEYDEEQSSNEEYKDNDYSQEEYSEDNEGTSKGGSTASGNRNYQQEYNNRTDSEAKSQQSNASSSHKTTADNKRKSSDWDYNDTEEDARTSSTNYQENTRKQHSSTSNRRRNYMGYDPDETRHRSFNVGNQNPTTLETKDATEEEISRLSSLLGRAFDKDSIVDENYLVRMRFYNSVKENVGKPKMTEKEFISKGHKYMQTSNGKYVHRCSARGGILYVSPSIWNRVKYDNCIICMYYGKKANQFIYIRSQKELMKMIDQDAVVVQITGNDKGNFINKVYDSKFPGMDGNIYTMIRTIKTSGDDFIFNPNDSNSKNDNEFDSDLV